jgi:hypothetical protein
MNLEELMEDPEVRRKREVAMQKLRPIVIKILDKIVEEAQDGLEDAAIDCLVEAGFDPVDEESGESSEEINAWMELAENCLDEATAFWHHRSTGPVYALVSFDVDTGNRMECEFFMDKPRTGSTPAENWPTWFRVFEGNVNGGDSVVVDSRGASFG